MYIESVKPAVCLLIALVPVLAGGVDEQSVMVKSASLDGEMVVEIAELRGKPTELICTITHPTCAKPQPGEYSMVRADDDEAVYQDCTDVVLYNNSSGAKMKTVEVYCWDSGDCYIASCVEVQVDTIPETMQIEPLRPNAVSAEEQSPSQ